MKKASMILGLALVMLLAVSGSLTAATVYVNYSTGNDTTGDGSSESPYKTFHKGYTEASTSDTLDLTGTFDWTNADETGDAVTSGYTISKNLTIQGQGATSTFIQAASAIDTADRRVFTTSNYDVTFMDLTIRYGYMNVDDGHGTAIYSSYGDLTIINCHISECKNPYDRYIRGAIYKSRDTFTMHNSSVFGNVNGYVAGIYLYCTTTITNSTIYNNVGQYGGGIMPTGYTTTLTNTTIVDNRSSYNMGGNVFQQGSSSVTVNNSIIANDQGGYDYYLYSGTVTDDGYNIVESSSGTTFSGTGTITGDQANLWGTGISATPSLADNGGPTHTLALASGSVAVNAIPKTAGGNTYNGCPPCDQRICSRPDGSGESDNRDMGAYELGAPLAIDLVSFTAKQLPAHVKVEWETAAELDTAGFHVWRADGRNKDFVRVTDWMIPAVGGPFQGAEYLWLDTAAVPGTAYWYKLEDISYGGPSTYHGPVKAMGKKPGAPGK